MIRLVAAGALALNATSAAAQRAVIEVVPANLAGPSAVVGAVAGAQLNAPAAILTAPALTPLAQTTVLVAPIAAITPAATAAARPLAAVKPGKLSQAASLAALNQTRLAQALPKGAALGRAPSAEAHGAGVALEDAMTGRVSAKTGSFADRVAGVWRAFVPSGLSRPSLARAAEPEGPAAASKKLPAGVSAEVQARVDQASELIARVRAEVGKVIVGQKEMIDALLMALISGEHVLLEGVPGVAKTATVKAFADSTEASFQRIQGVPDKLPSDILGAEILQEDPATGIKVLNLQQGPVVTHILLVDEINRMMPKTQAALLEAMQERKITIGRTTIPLPDPFIVLATQNPIEQEGTYRLPEAQQDRFMFKVIVNRPTREQLKEIMVRFSSREKSPKASKVTTLEEFVAAGKIAQDVYVSPEIEEWITHIVEATNAPEAYGLDLKRVIENGASPRAAIYLHKAAQARALLEGRSWVDRSDVFAVAPMILRHRILLSYEANKVTVEDVIAEILKARAVWDANATIANKGNRPGAGKPN